MVDERSASCTNCLAKIFNTRNFWIFPPALIIRPYKECPQSSIRPRNKIMSMYRALAPFRKAHFLRTRGPSSVADLFERDPFFAGIAPMLNTEFSPLRYNYPRVNIKEGPKAYHLEAEIPGFRKENLSIEFLDSRTLRISGKRGGKAAPIEAANETVESTEGDHIHGVWASC